jgi:anti-repressor protein
MKERIINYPDGRSMTTITPYVTGKGQVYFVNKFLKEYQKEAEG